jgi:Mg-chelatase subunit ChlI/Mg-chelatase subunit ChlD
MADPYSFVEENRAAIMNLLAKIDIQVQRRESQQKKKKGKNRGVAYRTRTPDDLKSVDMALLSTLRTAAQRGGKNAMKTGRLQIQKEDIKEKVRRIRKKNPITMLLDASASSEGTMVRRTLEVLTHTILMNTYQQRDRISIVECRGRRATVAQGYTTSLEGAGGVVMGAEFRGMSPLASGLMASFQLFNREKMVEPSAIPTVIVISDGDVNSPYRTGIDIMRELELLANLLEEEGFFVLYIDISEKGSPVLEKLSEYDSAFYYHAMQYNPRRRFFMPILGEELTKEALVLSSINPDVKGILLYGNEEIVHARKVNELAGVLPTMDVVTDCPHNCDPMDYDNLCWSCRKRKDELPTNKELPTSHIGVPIVQLHADADLEEMAGNGLPGGLPGVFGMANRGIILVEDIHKLDEEKKEVLIKAMDTGEIRFRKSEDEEIVIPATFKVIGTITGHVSSFDTIDRRLFDLFDIRIELKDARKVEDRTISERIEMIKQSMAFESDPLEYRKKLFRDIDIAETIVSSRELLPTVQIAQPELTLVGRLNVDFGNVGYEAELSMERLAVTIAAFEGEQMVQVDHVRRASELTYRFREKSKEEPIVKVSNIELLKSLVKNYAKE